MPTRILIVEDNDELRAELAAFLRGREYEVYEARAMREGLELATLQQPDVVITELMLPDSRNYRFAGAFRLAVKHALTIIGITWMPAIVFESARRVGFDEVLSKPIDHAMIVERIEARLRVLLDPTG
jgi:DNA-binding response OmpR family regulator